jgi:hypothetical protein
VALETSFQTNVGYCPALVPIGEISVGLPGIEFNENEREELQRPVPAEFQVCIHHFAVPLTTMFGVTSQIPVPLPQPALAAVYHLRSTLPVLSSIQM